MIDADRENKNHQRACQHEELLSAASRNFCLLHRNAMLGSPAEQVDSHHSATSDTLTASPTATAILGESSLKYSSSNFFESILIERNESNCSTGI